MESDLSVFLEKNKAQRKTGIKRARAKILSMGASNEEHGPAIPLNFDDIYATRVAALLSERTGAQYLGHLPYTSDRVGPCAKAWNHTYLDPEKVTNKIMAYIDHANYMHKSSGTGEFSHVFIYSGHGGNNFIKDDEKKIAKNTRISFLYLPPLEQCSALHSQYGTINPTHAGDGEHSLAAFFGMINQNGLDFMNKLAQNDPEQVVRTWPVVMGLLGYICPEFCPKSMDFTELHKRYTPEKRKQRKDLFFNRRLVIADADIGRQLFEQDVANSEKRMLEFLASD